MRDDVQRQPNEPKPAVMQESVDTMLLSQTTKPQQSRTRKPTSMLEPTCSHAGNPLPQTENLHTQPELPDDGIMPRSVMIGLRGPHCVVCDTLYENQEKRLSAIFHRCHGLRPHGLHLPSGVTHTDVQSWFSDVMHPLAGFAASGRCVALPPTDPCDGHGGQGVSVEEELDYAMFILPLVV